MTCRQDFCCSFALALRMDGLCWGRVHKILNMELKPSHLIPFLLHSEVQLVICYGGKPEFNVSVDRGGIERCIPPSRGSISVNLYFVKSRLEACMLSYNKIIKAIRIWSHFWLHFPFTLILMLLFLFLCLPVSSPLHFTWQPDTIGSE